MRYLFATLAVYILVFANSNSLARDSAIEQAWFCYLSGDYEKAVNTCRAVSSEQALGEEGHYIMGLSFLKLEQPQEARRSFEFVLENYPATRRKEEVLLGVADSYYIEKVFDNAEKYYKELIEKFPKTDYASMVYLRLGECQRKQGKWQDAEASFCKILCDYPLSLESKAAKVFLEERISCFSIQAGAFSKRRNGENFSAVLRKRGYDAYIEKTYEDDRLIYRVKVGKFATQGEADAVAAKLREEGFTVKVCS